MKEVIEASVEDTTSADFQLPEEYVMALEKAWEAFDFDPMLDSNPALSPSGKWCHACY